MTKSLRDSPRWRFQRRDLISVAAVAVWFALRGSEGLPFRSSDALEPARAVDIVGSSVALDRRELGSIPRLAGSGIVVGPVTVEQPEVPPLPSNTPDLPLPDVPTVPGTTLPSVP